MLVIINIVQAALLVAAAVISAQIFKPISLSTILLHVSHGRSLICLQAPM